MYVDQIYARWVVMRPFDVSLSYNTPLELPLPLPAATGSIDTRLFDPAPPHALYRRPPPYRSLRWTTALLPPVWAGRDSAARVRPQPGVGGGGLYRGLGYPQALGQRGDHGHVAAPFRVPIQGESGWQIEGTHSMRFLERTNHRERFTGTTASAVRSSDQFAVWWGEPWLVFPVTVC